MPEAIITYKKPETLKILKGLAKYFDFKIEVDKNKKKASFDDILIKGDKTLSVAELEDVFRGTNLDAKKLREEAWKRLQ